MLIPGGRLDGGPELPAGLEMLIPGGSAGIDDTGDIEIPGGNIFFGLSSSLLSLEILIFPRLPKPRCVLPSPSFEGPSVPLEAFDSESSPSISSS